MTKEELLQEMFDAAMSVVDSALDGNLGRDGDRLYAEELRKGWDDVFEEYWKDKTAQSINTDGIIATEEFWKAVGEYMDKHRKELQKEIIAAAVEQRLSRQKGQELRTVGDMARALSTLDADFEVVARITKEIPEEELQGMSYPYPFETAYYTLSVGDIGYSDKRIILDLKEIKE